jgi:lysophospholipase L1-like esterase
VWTWAIASFALMCLMFALVASGPGSTARTRARALDGPAPSTRNLGATDRQTTSRVHSESPGLDDDSPLDFPADFASAAPFATVVPGTLHSDLDRREAVEPKPGRSRRWSAFASRLRNEALQSNRTRLVLLGDSITEAWRGTSLGEPRAEYEKGAEIFRRRFPSLAEATLTLAVAGDTTENVLWRIRNGGFPPAANAPKYVAVLVGTNDLSQSAREARGGSRETGFASDEISRVLLERGVPRAAAGVLAVVDEITKTLAPDAKVIVLGITPRGERVAGNRVSYRQPSVWTAAIDAVNARLANAFASRRASDAAAAFSGKGSPPPGYANVVYRACSEPFLVRDSRGTETRVDARLMPDGLHPSGVGGFEALAECLAKGLEAAENRREGETARAYQ